jgi:hypothetical protein
MVANAWLGLVCWRNLQLIKKIVFKLTEKKLTDFRYSIFFITNVADKWPGESNFGGGRAITVIVGWFAGRTFKNHIKWCT